MNEQVRLSRSSSSGTKANSGWAVITTLVDRAACKNVKHALRHGVKYTWNLIHFILALKSHIMRVIYAKTYNVNVLFVHFKLMWELNASSPVTDTWGSMSIQKSHLGHALTLQLILITIAKVINVFLTQAELPMHFDWFLLMI